MSAIASAGGDFAVDGFYRDVSRHQPFGNGVLRAWQYCHRQRYTAARPATDAGFGAGTSGDNLAAIG